MPIDLDNFDILKALLGENILEYSIGIKSNPNLSKFSSQQTIALQNLKTIVQNEFPRYFDSVQNISFKEWIRIRLLHSRINNKPTLNYIRELSNIGFPSLFTEEPLCKALEDFAHFAYPSLLIKGRQVTFYDDSHTFFQELLKDQELTNALFPDQEDIPRIEVETSLIFNTGKGSGIQLVSLPDQLLRYAWELCLLENNRSFDHFMQTIPKAVQSFRKLILEGSVNVPLIIGLNNISVPEEFNEYFEDIGTIRAATKSDSQLFSGSFYPHNQKYYPVIFQATYSLAILDKHDNNEFSKFYNDFDSAYESNIEIPFQRFLLATMLASNSDSPVAIENMHVHIFNPIMHSSSTWKSERSATGQEVDFSTFDVSELRKWLKILNECDPSAISIAIRRIFDAYILHRSPIDGFMDIVIACESIFGGNAELSFRISTAMAKLIYPNNFEERKTTQRQIKNIYNDRSKIVHGAKKPDYDQCIKNRDQLCNYLLQCLRIIFSERTDLLKDSNRSQTIVLG